MDVKDFLTYWKTFNLPDFPPHFSNIFPVFSVFMETMANKYFLDILIKLLICLTLLFPFKHFLPFLFTNCSENQVWFPVYQLFGKSGVIHCTFLPYLIVSLDVWCEASHLGRGRVTIVSSDDYDFVELVECVYQSREGDTCCLVKFLRYTNTGAISHKVLSFYLQEYFNTGIQHFSTVQYYNM